MKIVVIGTSAAGHSAAVNLRNKCPDAGITLISQEEYPFYDRRKLMDYWAGRIKEKDLFPAGADPYGRQNISFLKNSKVVAVNPARRSVSYKAGEKRTSVEYDFLVVASGSKTVIPEIEGINRSGVFCFDSLADLKELRSAVMADAVCLIGSNHLTAAAIENIVSKQVEVKLVTDKPRENLPASVEVIGGKVTQLIGDSGVQAVKLESGKVIGVSWVGIMSEPAPNFDFLQDSGIELNNGAIAVDEFMHTSLENVLACGSVCLKRGETPRLKTWEESLAEGASAAEHIFKS